MFKGFAAMELTERQQTLLNITAAVGNMLVTTLISFVLSPRIVGSLGVAANGFVGLANQFTSYAALISTALNSMGSRFLMMAYYRDDHRAFRRYYSSLLFADLVLAALFGLLGCGCIRHLEGILDIPAELVGDVKGLFALTFCNFVLSTAMTVWAAAPFLKNRLYLNAVTNSLSTAVRGVLILGLFACLKPAVSLVGLATLLSGCVVYGFGIFYKRTLFPGLRARWADFSWSAIRELLCSGIWNTVSNVGHLLTGAVDLLAANLFVSAAAMGVLSVAHTMPTLVNTLNEAIAGAITPSLIMDYARDRTDALIGTILRSARLISVICSLPLGFLLVYGREFYALWQPTQNAGTLYALSVILIFGRVFFTGLQPLFSVFTVVNRVREHSLVTVANGLASVALMLLLLQTTDLGVYAIAGASVVCCFFKNMLFVIPFSARYLGLKGTAFYRIVTPSVLCCGILCLWGSFLKGLYCPTGWLALLGTGAVFAAGGLCLTCAVVLDRAERRTLMELLRKRRKP